MKKILSFIFLIITFNISAQIVLPSIFSDNMVLQRDMEIPVWGKANPLSKITVSFHGQKKITTADKEGNWKLYLSPVSADRNPPTSFPRQNRDKIQGGLNPRKMLIESDNSKITFTNVLVGEVWLCSGQSNMKFELERADEGEKYIAEANDNQFRFYQAERFYLRPYECDNCLGDWKICTSNSVRKFSAAGYFFGLELREKLNVPIGLIEADFGGTEIEAWMNSNDLKKWSVYKKELDSLDKYKNHQKFIYYRKKEKKEFFEKLKVIDPGFKENWMSPGFDDSKWSKVKLPRAWDMEELKGHTGIVWYRKKINIPPEWHKKDIFLSLGLIKGYDLIWFNGKLVWHALEHYASWWDRLIYIPWNEIKPGENTLVICNLSGNGSAGPRGPQKNMKIYLKDLPTNSISIVSNWRYKKGYEGKDFPGFPVSLTLNQNTKSIQYDTMIQPILPYAIRGVIWYQGESNRDNANMYEDLFSTMIKSWRGEWGEGDFPFYFVQISPFSYRKGNSAFLQEAQFKTLKLTNTGMAVTLDIGDLKSVHPKNKKNVGHRLALWALAKDYGYTNLVYSGPLYKDHKIEGNKIIIAFDFAKGLKTRDGKPLTHFEIAGNDKKFYPAETKIINDKVAVSSKKVKLPVAVRFAWSNDAQPNLCNSAGLPASTFRTDN
ncbi:sialate O-acetylesterase [bacterium]|nr:sialate O-acetylesterase [bacterium]